MQMISNFASSIIFTIYINEVFNLFKIMGYQNTWNMFTLGIVAK